jgi:hypothetical protein
MEHIAGFKETNKARQPKFVRWAVMLGIIILLNVFFVVGRGLLFTSPQYTDFCPVSTPLAETASTCAKNGGDWVASGPAALGTTPKTQGGYCDYTQKCQKPYDAAEMTYETESFVFLVVLGVLSILIGVFVPLGSSIVSTGLSYGGVLAFIVASVGYWHDATQLIQLVISALGLAALIYIGIKRFRD